MVNSAIAIRCRLSVSGRVVKIRGAEGQSGAARNPVLSSEVSMTKILRATVERLSRYDLINRRVGAAGTGFIQV
jgi:hypothetical protein